LWFIVCTQVNKRRLDIFRELRATVRRHLSAKVENSPSIIFVEDPDCLSGREARDAARSIMMKLKLLDRSGPAPPAHLRKWTYASDALHGALDTNKFTALTKLYTSPAALKTARRMLRLMGDHGTFHAFCEYGRLPFAVLGIAAGLVSVRVQVKIAFRFEFVDNNYLGANQQVEAELIALYQLPNNDGVRVSTLESAIIPDFWDRRLIDAHTGLLVQVEAHPNFQGTPAFEELDECVQSIGDSFDLVQNSCKRAPEDPEDA
jgi:hypothetical protein